MMITTKYLAATNTKGARIKATMNDDDKTSITMSYQHEDASTANHIAAARRVAVKKGVAGLEWTSGITNDGRGYLFLNGNSHKLGN